MNCMYFDNNRGTMIMLKRLCKEFYRLPECGAGGPLHILLDDDNYDTDSILFCLRGCLSHPDNAVRTLGVIICKEYLRMSILERAVFDSYWCDYSTDCFGECNDCKLVSDVDWEMIEKEKRND